jgi:hypothetical protein
VPAGLGSSSVMVKREQEERAAQQNFDAIFSKYFIA